DLYPLSLHDALPILAATGNTDIGFVHIHTPFVVQHIDNGISEINIPKLMCIPHHFPSCLALEYLSVSPCQLIYRSYFTIGMPIVKNDICLWKSVHGGFG